MNELETLELLGRVQAIWCRQRVDELVHAEWTEWLARTEYRDALDAVCEFRDAPDRDAPTPGMVAQLARRIAERRRKVRLLELPRPTPEQIARNRALLKDLLHVVVKDDAPKGA
jgi:hypothetical protein